MRKKHEKPDMMTKMKKKNTRDLKGPNLVARPTLISSIIYSMMMVDLLVDISQVLLYSFSTIAHILIRICKICKYVKFRAIAPIDYLIKLLAIDCAHILLLVIENDYDR